jgi:hypothetical protein
MEVEKAIAIVANAIAQVLPLAGQSYDTDDMQSASVRAKNLIEQGYVTEPTWDAGGIVQVNMEQHGYGNDCVMPFDYYDGGMDASFRVSEALTPELTGAPHGWYVEFVNAGVAKVYPV